ncbi:hypothetical protein AC1031_012464 [Aphanomyces cochlioides]|nr:hypothetical protein AC1031_012464 [Aphanomyces cochlioides]
MIAVAPAQPSHGHHHLHPSKRAKALSRIVFNLFTFSTVAIVTVLIFVLAGMGFFYRHDILNDLAIDANSLQAYGQNCRMTSDGFVVGTCTSIEIATTADSPWSTIGQRLAKQWFAQSSSPYYVTTCLKTKPTNSAQMALVFLAGYDAFPLCQPPNGPQEIAGMAMLETTVRDEFPDGVFMLTVYSDKAMSESAVHVNSDGSTDLLITNINQTLIATNGSVSVDTLGINGVHYSDPLGEFFKVSTYSYPVVLDATLRINPTMLAGWNVGRNSKKIVTMTWDYGHQVENRYALVGLQLGALSIGSVLIAGDFYLTIQGLKGFLANQPIMTFDLAAGFERRKLVILFWGCSELLGLVYFDIVRVYVGSTYPLWFTSTMIIGALCLSGFFILLGLLTCIPSPFHHVLTFSSGAMNHVVFLGLEVVFMLQLPSILDQYRKAPQALALNILGTLRPSGAYADGGHIDSAASHLIGSTFATLVGCTLVSILVSTIQLKRTTGKFLLDLEWTRSNRFLSQSGIPNWITGLPLDGLNMIKIGNNLYCKPSTQATLGIASIVPRRDHSVNTNGASNSKPTSSAPAHDSTEHVVTLVSVYSLLPILWSLHRWMPISEFAPKVFGTVEKNTFTPGNNIRIAHDQFHHDRGVCVN